MSSNSPKGNEEREFTTVTLSRRVYNRISELKPYESLSYSEFVNEMCDQYEREVTQ